jgi:hypothetical protein
MRRTIVIVLSLVIHIALSAQSKTIEKFRKAHPEDQNVFFYSSTLNMLNVEESSDFENLIKDIEKIAVLIYKKENKALNSENINGIIKGLKKEKYVELMIINESGNKINLYKKDKKDRTVGFAAFVDNEESLVLIDVKGSIDFKKFMELKNKIDLKL